MVTDWQQLAGMAAVLGSVVVALGWLWRVTPRVWKWVKYKMGGALREDITELKTQMTFIVSELKPNGGASIRDSLNRIEIRQVLQEQRQKAILSDMSVGVFEADNEGHYLWVNRKYLRMTGRAPSEVNGSGWINTVAERDRERVMSEWTEAVATGREFEGDYLMITPDDERLEVSVRTYKMMDDNGEPLGYIGILSPAIKGGRIDM